MRPRDLERERGTRNGARRPLYVTRSAFVFLLHYTLLRFLASAVTWRGRACSPPKSRVHQIQDEDVAIVVPINIQARGHGLLCNISGSSGLRSVPAPGRPHPATL